MSYVQGTIVRLEGHFEEPDPDNPRVMLDFDPPEVLVTIVRPDGTFTQRTLSGGTVFKESDGHYYAELDTSPAIGTWRYQFENPGARRALKWKELTVRAPATVP